MESIVQATNLTKSYKNCVALHDVSISINRGEVFGLVGANGAGKTTFLKVIAGQVFHDSGEFRLFGKCEQREVEAARRRTGVIIEAPAFYPQMSVEANMKYYRIQKGIPGEKRVEEILKLVGLWEHRKKKGKALSLGMKQRLGLAIALLGEPELLLLDEPINGLDPSGIIEIRQLLRRLNEEKNITIIISSHILSELEQLATGYGFLNKGELIEKITAKALLEKCEDYLDIVVTDVEKYTMLLEKLLQHKSYKVLEDKTVRILEMNRSVEDYSAIASANSIGIKQMKLGHSGLEEYYMSLTGGVK